MPDPTSLPAELTRDVRRTLEDLRRTRLAATAWPAVAGDLGRLARAIERADEAAVRKALVPVAQASFEGKVRGRLAGADRRAAAYVAPSKSTPALPIVGLVSAAVLVTVGYLIGGWPVAAITAAFAVFIAVVAYAGSHSNRARIERRRADAYAPSRELTEPPPTVVEEAVVRIERQLVLPPRAPEPDA